MYQPHLQVGGGGGVVKENASCRHLDALEVPMVQEMMSFYKEDKNALRGSCSQLCSLAGSVLLLLGDEFSGSSERKLAGCCHTFIQSPEDRLSKPGLMRLQDDLPLMFTTSRQHNLLLSCQLRQLSQTYITFATRRVRKFSKVT